MPSSGARGRIVVISDGDPIADHRERHRQLPRLQPLRYRGQQSAMTRVASDLQQMQAQLRLAPLEPAQELDLAFAVGAAHAPEDIHVHRLRDHRQPEGGKEQQRDENAQRARLVERRRTHRYGQRETGIELSEPAAPPD
jgi:hypothetical protein